MHRRAQGTPLSLGQRPHELWCTDYKVPIGDRLLTLGEAAEVLRLSARTLREYAQRGEVEARIIGGRWRFRRGDLDAFFENAPRNWDFAGDRAHEG